MANIAEYLKKMLSARYGRDVRQSIHDSIDAINKDVNDYNEYVTQKATEVAQNAENANTANAAAQTAAQSASNAYQAAKQQAGNAQASADSAAQLVTDAQALADNAAQSATDASTSASNAQECYEKSQEIYDNFQVAGGVAGVKGAAEETYRTGMVEITAEDVGAARATDFEEHTDDTTAHITAEERTNWNNAAAHTNNKNNPHGVTAEQIGLGNVDNTADKDKNVKHAESATQDGNGNNIPDTYATKQSLIDNFNNYGHWGSAFFNSNDVNTWIKAGIYCTITSQDFNLPSQIDGWSTVLVLASNGTSSRITQICWGWNDASYTLYKRGTGNSGANWSDWVAIVDEGNITRCITPNKIGAVESRKITEPTDFNQFQETGIFYINFLGASNQPVYAHGLLIVNFDIGTPFHIFIPDTVNAILKRNWHGTYWSDWYNAIDASIDKSIEFQIVDGELQYRYDTEVWG